MLNCPISLRLALSMRAGAVGLKSAIDYVKSVGFEEIHKRELEVSAYAF